MTSRRLCLPVLPTLVALLALSGSPELALAQEPPGLGRHSPPATVDASAPRLIHSTGRLVDGLGSPMVGVVTVTFAVYERQGGGPALWVEIQRLTTDKEGRYSALLGAVSPGGVPVELFSSTAPRWLGVQAEQLPEQPRVLLVSVPYAMKAADAETLGGRPASDYLLAAAAQPQAQAATSSDKSLKGLGTPGALPLFTAPDTVGDSILFQSNGNVGIGTLSPAARLDVSGDVRSTGRVTAATGRYSASTGTTETLRAEISATGGYAIIGLASPGPTQTGTGVFGWLLGQSGAAVAGEASATTGLTVGVQGRAHSPSGVGGLFENSAGGDLLRAQTTSGNTRFRVDASGTVHAGAYRDLAGNPIPSGDITAVSGGTGLTGGGSGGDVSLSLDTAFTDARYAAMLHGHLVDDVVGAATLGANAFSGNQTVTGLVSVTGGVYGFTTAGGPAVLGQSSAANSLGVRGTATGTGQTTGVLGFANSPSGTGVEGESVSPTGATVGVLGKVVSPDGVAVLGQSLQNNGATAGVKGTVNSAAGFAGLFDNVAGGTILSGRRNGVERFRVDGDGNIYATGYRDLAGNPIPSGTGDITAVNPGTGLTGGGGAGDVNLALDTGYTNTLYAPVVHGHVVGQVAGAATLGANAFAGNQNVTGNLSVIGAADVDGGIAAFGGPTKPNAVGVRGETSSATAEGVLGVAISVTGRGARGHATGTAGTGIKGEASATSGATTGVLGTVASPSGIAGLFENTAGGDLLKGVSAGSPAFRVDGSGAVYAASYRDLAGNPIPAGTGDITAVTAGTGLTGGGGTGDLSLALDTSYTNTLYAAAVHGHTVAQVAGAATLGANAFTGAQQISHTLNVSGDGVAQSSLLATNSLTSGISVRGTAFGVGGRGVYGEGSDGVQGVSANATGRGVFGWATNSTGTGVGVNGQAGGSSGVGVSGQAYSTTGVTRGVLGTSSSADGIGVDGVASAAAGPAVGVRGRSSAAGAGVQAIATGTGAAGVFDHTAGGDLLVGRSGGGLTPVFRVDGTGRGFFNNGTQVGGADFAESFAVSGERHEHEPGDVLIIDTTRRRTLEKSSSAYSTMVAGVHSTKPGVLASPHPAGDPRLAEEVPLAVVGIVPCKVTAENGPIRAGDLLVTSSTPGYAMKGIDRTRMLGAIVGKALEPLNEASGTILVLITLQ